MRRITNFLPSVFSLQNGCRSSTNDKLFFWHTASAAVEHIAAICGEKALLINSRGVNLHWAMILARKSTDNQGYVLLICRIIRLQSFWALSYYRLLAYN